MELGFTIQTMDSCKNIVFSDEELVVLNKPAGVVAHRQRPDCIDAQQLAEEELGIAAGSLKPIHRLDATTSGLMLFGRNKRSARYYCQLLQNMRVHKSYLTIVEGRLEKKKLICTGNIKKTSKKSYVVTEGGQSAKTIVCPLELFPDFTFCEVSIEHGRKHQIRAHLAHAGFPILADTLYGAKEYGALSHLLLHAAKLDIRPKKGPRRTFEAPLPRKFQEVLKELRQRDKRE